MSDPDALSEGAPDGAHSSAAAAFAGRVERRDVPVEELLLFGSTARGEASGLASDVDFLAIVADDADREDVVDRLRAIAYDVMLEYGPVVEVHVLARSEFERRREQEHPFVLRVLRDGRSYD